MHAKTPVDLPIDLEPEYDADGLFGPEWEKSVAEEVRRRRADPAQTMTIDAEAAFDEIDALLDRL